MAFSFYLILIFLFLRGINGAVRDVAIIDELVHCPDAVPIDEFDLSNVTLTTVRAGEVRINGQAFIGGIGIPEMEKILFLVYKCNSKHDLSNCEKVTEFPFQNACTQVHKEGEVWSTLILNIKPKIECPIKGLYEVKDAYLDPVMVNKYLPKLKGAYWKLRMEVMHKNELRGCIQIHFFLQSLADRRKNKG